MILYPARSSLKNLLSRVSVKSINTVWKDLLQDGQTPKSIVFKRSFEIREVEHNDIPAVREHCFAHGRQNNGPPQDHIFHQE